ncbi:MAG: hypothetical protein ABIG95_04810 [Candidatus Woesearchaeota archaeon]
MNEIERKFLVRKLPDLAGKESVRFERYFLKIEPYFEDRIQKKVLRMSGKRSLGNLI